MKKTLLASLLVVSMTAALAQGPRHHGHYQGHGSNGNWVIPALIVGSMIVASQANSAQVYVQPQPVYVQPPVYVDPQPVYGEPRVIYQQQPIVVDEMVYNPGCRCYRVIRKYYSPQ